MELLRGIIYQSVEDCTQRIFFFAILSVYRSIFHNFVDFFFIFPSAFYLPLTKCFALKIDPMNWTYSFKQRNASIVTLTRTVWEDIVSASMALLETAWNAGVR